MDEEKKLLTCSCPGCENQFYLEDVPYIGLYDAFDDKNYVVRQLTKEDLIPVCPACFPKVLYGVTIALPNGALTIVDLSPEEIAECLKEEDPT